MATIQTSQKVNHFEDLINKLMELPKSLSPNAPEGKAGSPGATGLRVTEQEGTAKNFNVPKRIYYNDWRDLKDNLNDVSPNQLSLFEK